jgi:general secretion pathway protein G
LKQISLWLVIEFSGNQLKITLNKKAGVTPAFTMVELIFVIVVLGVLAAVAIPRLAASRDDAVIVKGKSQVSAIRSGIAMQRSTRMIQGQTPFIPRVLEGNTTQTAAQATTLFFGGVDGNILEYSLPSRNTDGNWEKTSANTANPITYNFYVNGVAVNFDYTPADGTFDCNHAIQECRDLTE